MQGIMMRASGRRKECDYQRQRPRFLGKQPKQLREMTSSLSSFIRRLIRIRLGGGRLIRVGAGRCLAFLQFFLSFFLFLLFIR
jgi:hypothetical protein